MKKKQFLRLAFGLLLTIIIGGYTYMQSNMSNTASYPTKPITIIVPFSPGGGMDLVARVLEKLAPKYLGQPFLVLNKPGGAGAIAWNELSSASPDGYTIGMTAPELLTLPLYGTTKYHYPTALEPLAQVSISPMVMVVQVDQPWQDLTAVINYAKEHPGQLKFGHGGIGSLSHIIGESFSTLTHSNLQQVPFRGGVEATTALLGKHIEIAIVGTSVAKEHIKKGTLRAVAVSGEHRISDPIFAQTPTFKEQNLDLVFNNWFVIAAPKDLPPAVKVQLAAGLKSMILDPDFKNNMDALGVEIEYLDRKATATLWIEEKEKLTNLLEKNGILDLIKSLKTT